MLKILLRSAPLLIFLLALFSPLSALADGSCQCTYYNAKLDTQTTEQCTASTDASQCTAKEKEKFGRTCAFYETPDCTTLPDPSLRGLTKSDAECKTDPDCAAYTQNLGKSKCWIPNCYFDLTAKRAYEQQHVSVLGVLGGDLKPTKPILSIRIPGLNFSESIITSVDANGKKTVKIPYLGEYIATLYKYGVALVSIVAVVMIMFQGARIITSAGGEEKMAGYKRIAQVIIGLALMWGSFTILYIINPDLVGLRVIELPYIEREAMPEIDLPTPEEAAQVPPSTISCDNPAGTNLTKITPVPGLKVDAGEPYTTVQVYDALKRAAQIADSRGYVLDVTSACRSLARQQSLAASNSGTNKVGNTIAKPGGSAHGSGTAVDVALLSKNNPSYRNALVPVGDASTQCKVDAGAVKTLSEIMYAAGFTRFTKENWHFEIPARIPTCRSTSYTGLSPCNPKPGECP